MRFVDTSVGHITNERPLRRASTAFVFPVTKACSERLSNWSQKIVQLASTFMLRAKVRSADSEHYNEIQSRSCDATAILGRREQHAGKLSLTQLECSWDEVSKGSESRLSTLFATHCTVLIRRGNCVCLFCLQADFYPPHLILDVCSILKGRDKMVHGPIFHALHSGDVVQYHLPGTFESSVRRNQNF